MDGRTGPWWLFVTQIHTILRLPDGTDRDCFSYHSSGTGIASFYIMWIDGVCCHRSWKQSNTECTKQLGTLMCDPSIKDFNSDKFCVKDGKPGKWGIIPSCATDTWRDGCKGCMCYVPGNPMWCDGLKGQYYDKYFEEHGMNPWGDSNWKNRKCNTDPLPADW